MSTISYPYNLVQGLSDFWQRFFADSPQLEALYSGMTYLIGQAYLDMLVDVLSVSIVDCPLTTKEYWKLITIREDQVKLVSNVDPLLSRFAFKAPDNVVGLGTLDNKVINASASLQNGIDFDFDTVNILFKDDPTGDGNPIPGFARRQIDVEMGGRFDATSRIGGFNSWLSGAFVRKGDILRILDVSPTPDFNQRRVIDYEIALVRDDGLYISNDVPAPVNTVSMNMNWTILRTPSDGTVILEPLTFVLGVATLAHSRIVRGSVRVYGKVLATGLDVKEDIDYSIDYERGKIIQITAWAPWPNKANYQWLFGVFPSVNGPPPFLDDGILTEPLPARVIEMAMWAPDVLVDKRLLSFNFGTLIGKEAASSEAYRAFLRGIFQLYVLGPVLNRTESALNVILGLPVIRDDGEFLTGFSNTDPNFNQVTTARVNGTVGTYTFPKSTPLRDDIQDPAKINALQFEAFETLTTAVTVTDYIQDPNWWHHALIPREMFSTADGATIPSAVRRTVSPLYVENVTNPIDGAETGDPGIITGADDEGNLVGIGHPIYRHRLAFVLMDRFLKFHIFYVKFHDSVFVDTGVGVKFARDPDELRRLVLSAKPSHTFAYAQPFTDFKDSIFMADERWYQPLRFPGVDPNGPELFDLETDVPDITKPHILLGLFIGPHVRFISDKVLFVDEILITGLHGWATGDFFRYELFTDAANFGGGTATAGNDPGPPPPRYRKLVRVYIDGAVGGSPLIEDQDYSVNYATGVITRLTVWDNNLVNLNYLQLNIGNIATGVPNAAAGDTLLITAQQDPDQIRGAYLPAVDDPISLVERTLTVKVM